MALIRERTRDFGISIELTDRSIGVQNGVRNVRAGIVEMRSIRGVERFSPKLDFDLLPQDKLAEQSEIDADQTWSGGDADQSSRGRNLSQSERNPPRRLEGMPIGPASRQRVVAVELVGDARNHGDIRRSRRPPWLARHVRHRDP